MTRNVTPPPDPRERFSLRRLCQCTTCDGAGKVRGPLANSITVRCPHCRGEGRTLQEVATCGPNPEAIGTALYTLALKGEWDECPIGILDRIPEPGNQKWLVRPWLPSARNLSDAGRQLQTARKGKP